MTKPVVVTATQAELDALLAQALLTFTAEQYALLEGVLGSFVYLMRAVQDAKISIRRLQQMMFGARTESSANLFTAAPGGAAADSTSPAVVTSADPTAAAAANDDAAATVGTDAVPKSPKGHGRNGAQAYCNSPVVEVSVPNLVSGDPCPLCATGKVYESPPRVIVKVIGQPPLVANIFRLKRLRCRLCDAIFTGPMPATTPAPAPFGLQSSAPAKDDDQKYDASCACMLALLRYGCGMPLHRLQGLQQSLNVPLSDATQWDIVHRGVVAPREVFNALVVHAAQGELLHNDDTPARILSLMAQRTKDEAAGVKPLARAINTTGILALVQERKVALFFTGHAHAGTNLTQVLVKRAKDLAPPLQMCDALAANVPREFATILCNCLSHGRRQFAALIEHFPLACQFVIQMLAKVYGFDAHCRDKEMSGAQRLVFHQTHSAPLMGELHLWMNAQFEQRLVEPNSALGRALRYMIRHWAALTQFLHTEGAPLDNNAVERILKWAIRHRKNSLFYKTITGAEVGDIYMSLIHTCELSQINPFEYLQALMQHAQEVKVEPSLWLPWNYRDRLAPDINGRHAGAV